jgi:hypothetical protein
MLVVSQFGIASMVFGQEKCPYQRLQILVPGEEPAPGTEAGKTGEPLDQRVGVPFDVLVRACKTTWETHTGVTHVMQLSSTDDTANLPSVMPMVAGEVTMSVTLNATGSFTITARDLTDREHYTATSSVVRVGACVGIPDALRISSLGPVLTAGVPVEVTIEAVDQNGNRVTDLDGSLDLSQLTSLGTGRMTPETARLNDGSWTGPITFLLADHDPLKTAEGRVRLYAEFLGPDAIDGTSNSFDVQPGPYSRLQILLPGQERAAAATDGLVGTPAIQTTGIAFPARVVATDAYWNQVQDCPLVLVTPSDLAAAMPVSATLIDGAGSLDMIFGTPGLWALTVGDTTDPAIEPMTSEPFQVLSSVPTFVIDPVPDSVVAGISFPVNITVTGPDGSTLTDYNGPAMLACETGPASMSPEEITFENGIWTGRVTMYGAAPSSAFSCIDYAAPPNIGTSGRLEVLPADFTGLQVILPGQTLVGGLNPALTGEPTAQTAGQALEFRILAVDSWFNHVPDAVVNVALSSTDPYADMPDSVQVDQGAVTVTATFRRAGDHEILAENLEGEIPPTSPSLSTTFEVRCGPYARLIMLAPGEELVSGSESGKVGDPVDQSVSYGFHLWVHATDAWWNIRTDVEDVVELTVTDPLAELPPPFALDNGTARVVARLSTGGYQLLTATNVSREEIPEAQTQVRATNSGFHLEVELNPAVVVAGHDFTLSVLVTNDAGAVMHEINGQVNVHALNASTGQPGIGQLTTSTFQLRQGRRTITETYTGAEPIILVVSDDLGNEPGITNLIEIIPGPPSSLEFDDAPSWVGGRKTANVNALITDTYGNGIDNIPVQFSLTSGSGALASLDEVTNLRGLAEARYTGHSEPEMSSIVVEGAGLTKELVIETALVDPTLPAGSITNYPNPFHPEEGVTTIDYKLASDADVTLRMYTLSGSEVFVNKYSAGELGGRAGNNEIEWTGENGQGETVASGGYILEVEAEHDGESIHKMRRRIGVVR